MALLERTRPLVRALGFLVLLGGFAGVGWALLRPRSGVPRTPTIRVPDSTGITVEVLNGSGRQGLARSVTRMLRLEGFDVMYFGSARDSVKATEVLSRRGDSTAALKVAKALGLPAIRVARDTLLRIDVTVLLGPDYQLPGSKP
jgi:hypothetical protein